MNNLKVTPSSTSFRAMNTQRMGKVAHNNMRGLLKSLAVAVPLALGTMSAPAKTNTDCFTLSEQCCNHKSHKTCSNKSRYEESNNENNSSRNSENKNGNISDIWIFITIIAACGICGALCILGDDDRKRF